MYTPLQSPSQSVMPSPETLQQKASALSQPQRQPTPSIQTPTAQAAATAATTPRTPQVTTAAEALDSSLQHSSDRPSPMEASTPPNETVSAQAVPTVQTCAASQAAASMPNSQAAPATRPVAAGGPSAPGTTQHSQATPQRGPTAAAAHVTVAQWLGSVNSQLSQMDQISPSQMSLMEKAVGDVKLLQEMAQLEPASLNSIFRGACKMSCTQVVALQCMLYNLNC